MPPAIKTLLGLLVAGLGVAGVTTGLDVPAKASQTLPTVTAPPLSSANVPDFYRARAPLPPGPPGSLLRAERVTGVPSVPRHARVWRILYRSETVSGHGVAVSGYVIAPSVAPPAGGYRVIAWTHGTTGTSARCAPSLFTNLDGQSLYIAPYLDLFLAASDVVVATDYQGLGTSGVHPYLVGVSEAMNSLDAVRAASHLPGVPLSSDVVVVGHSQGGQAALFAGEIARSYSPDLRLLGVVAIAPATNISAAVTAADYLTSRGGISDNQGDLDYVAMALWAWTHTYRGLPVTSIFTSAGVSDMKAAGTGCLPQIAVSLRRVGATKIFRSGAVGSSAVQHYATLNNPGQVRSAAPILVVQGTNDSTVPYAVTTFFVRTQACAVGDQMTYTLYRGASHGGVIAPARSEVLSYVAARFAGRSAPSVCVAGDDSTHSLG